VKDYGLSNHANFREIWKEADVMVFRHHALPANIVIARIKDEAKKVMFGQLCENVILREQILM
jgi:hypothetical protein